MKTVQDSAFNYWDDFRLAELIMPMQIAQNKRNAV